MIICRDQLWMNAESHGNDATKEQAEQLAEDIENTHEDVEVEVQYGGQPVYSYFISVE